MAPRHAFLQVEGPSGEWTHPIAELEGADQGVVEARLSPTSPRADRDARWPIYSAPTTGGSPVAGEGRPTGMWERSADLEGPREGTPEGAPS